MLEDLSPRRRALTIVAMAAVVAVVAGALLSFRPEPRLRGVSVFVVPGYGGDAASVAALGRALRDAGRDVRVVVPPENGRASIADGVAALHRAVVRSGAYRADVVGFSAGGVVARAWAVDRGRALANNVVTIGAPHHGTTVLDDLGAAAEQCTGTCSDLRPGSGLLVRLNAGDETPGDAYWVTIWTSDDTTVVPPESARLDGARNIRVQDVCEGRRVSHGGLVTDPVVLRWVVAMASFPQGPIDCE